MNLISYILNSLYSYVVQIILIPIFIILIPIFYMLDITFSIRHSYQITWLRILHT